MDRGALWAVEEPGGLQRVGHDLTYNVVLVFEEMRIQTLDWEEALE